MKIKMDEEVDEVQAGFRPGTGTRNQILNLKMIIEKSGEYGKNVCLCFIDYRKAFDMVSHNVLWSVMANMGYPAHIIHLIKQLYGQQKAAVKTSHGLTDWFTIEQGVRQGCILSPHLFNIYSEQIMRNALDGFVGSVKVSGRTISNLRYADDVVLIASSMDELQDLVNRVIDSSLQFGLALHSSKTKVMKIVKNNQTAKDADHITVSNNEIIENVKEFVYLGTLITNNYYDTKEIRRRLCIARSAMVLLTNIWKDKSITITAKKRLLHTLVFSIASYGSECWVLKNIDKKKIEAFELWCYRRLLRISWTEKKTNEWILNKMDVSERLLTTINRRKVAFVGHMLRGKDITNDLLLGMVYGMRGRPKVRYSDNIKEISGGKSMLQLYRMEQDRRKWRATAVYFEPPVR